MDILAHGLWAGAAALAVQRHARLDRTGVAATVGLALLPDLLHLLPILAWVVLGEGPAATLRAYAFPVPGQEPALPPMVHTLSHHLHCIPHSLVIAAAVTLLLTLALRRWWWPLMGWWMHIVLDVPTHSADYYAVPVLYPFTMRGIDGIAWNTPWFMAANYAALGGAAAWLILRRRRRARRGVSR
jgi:hypothetical protein